MYNVKVRNFMFVDDGNTRQQVSFFFWTLIQSFRIQLQKQIYNIWRIKRDGTSAIKFEATRIHFLSDVFVAVAVAVTVAVTVAVAVA